MGKSQIFDKIISVTHHMFSHPHENGLELRFQMHQVHNFNKFHKDVFFCQAIFDDMTSFNPADLVVLIKVVQVMLEALRLYLPRTVDAFWWHQDFFKGFHCWLMSQPENLPKTNWVLNKLHATSKPLADCSSSSSGKDEALRIGSHGWPLQI